MPKFFFFCPQQQRSENYSCVQGQYWFWSQGFKCQYSKYDAKRRLFYPQVHWGEKGSTEAGARLAKAKVTGDVSLASCLFQSLSGGRCVHFLLRLARICVHLRWLVFICNLHPKRCQFSAIWPPNAIQQNNVDNTSWIRCQSALLMIWCYNVWYFFAGSPEVSFS